MGEVKIFGIDFSNLSAPGFIQFLKEKMQDKSKLLIYDINTYNLYLYNKSPKIKKVVDRADLIFADGMSVVLAGKLVGKSIKRYTGVDRMMDLIDFAYRENLSIFLLGGTESILSKCITNLKNSHKGLKITGFYHGFFDTGDEISVVNRINTSRPDILFIGMPVEKTASFLEHNLELLDVSVIMPVGGGFEILSGDKKRAPKIVQNIGMEWFYRLVQDPKGKLKRYLVSHSYFLFLLIKEFYNQRVKKSYD